MGSGTNIIQQHNCYRDLRWALKSYTPQQYLFSEDRRPQKIKETVLKSENVQQTIMQLCKERGCSKKEIEKEAKQILQEMGHNMQVCAIRGFGFVLSKLGRELFTGVYVNEDGAQKLKKIVPEYPILFMPTHRSYVDFLLVSFICFQFNLPVPVIAAGLDFLSMRGVNVALRNAGAFFIRRSFGQDLLYWSIFTEYVQTHVVNGDAPIEFFVEGTRSRTAKTLVPKLGFLTAALEPYFKSEVTDIAIVPISITYDRTLEELLYAYELIGVPKPKESTKGLLKARQILNDCYGPIHAHLGEPIIFSKFCAEHNLAKIPRVGPKHTIVLTAEEQAICKLLAYRAVRQNQLNAIISSFSLVACIVLVNLQKGISRLPLHLLVKEFVSLKETILALGHNVSCNSNEDARTVVLNAVAIHHTVLQTCTEDEAQYVQIVQAQSNASTPVTKNAKLKGHSLQADTITNAVPHVLLSHYSNQMIHVFIRISFVTLSLTSLDSDDASVENIFSMYTFLEKLLNNDFIFEPDNTELDFKNTLNSLERLGLVDLRENSIILKHHGDQLISLVHQLIEPFLISYRVMCSTIMSCENPAKIPSASTLVRDAQAHVEQLLLQNRITSYVSLSLDILNNCVFSLLNMGALHKIKTDNGVSFQSDPAKLMHVIGELDKMNLIPDIAANERIVAHKTSSKL